MSEQREDYEAIEEQLDLDTFESEEGERRAWRGIEDTAPL